MTKQPGFIVLTDLLKRAINSSPEMQGLREQIYQMIEGTAEEIQEDLDKDPVMSIHRIYAVMDDRLKELVPKTSCKKGCSNCCKINVDISDAEAKLITEYCREMNIPIDYDYLKRQQPLTQETRFFDINNRDCVFLNAYGECRIYDFRPIGCRKYYVTSDPENCDISKQKNPMNLIDSKVEILASALYNTSESFDNMATMLLKHRNHKL